MCAKLPVGHMHEDIGRFFSRVSTKVKQNGAESILGIYTNH